MPESADRAFIDTYLFANPGFRNMADHILSLLLRMIYGLLAWRLNRFGFYPARWFVTHFRYG